MTASRVWVSGVGTYSSAGTDAAALFQAVLENRSSIHESLGRISDQTLAQVPGVPTGVSKPVLLSWISVQQAMQQAGWSGLNSDDGLIIGTTAGQIPLWEGELLRYGRKEIDDFQFAQSIQHQSLGAVGEALSELLGFQGKFLLLASACSAATQALALGSMWIRQGKVKRCLVGGVEVLSQLTIEGFRSLQILSPERATPFDLNRQGINLSEGAGFFCLEADSRNPLAAISGFGLTTDAFHMASPHPEGRGSYQAMKQALISAGLTPQDIDWVHAHGTGSKANDQAEGAAVQKLFEERGTEGPWMSSTKYIHGHALGASGAIETALCIEALGRNTVLKTGGLTAPDPEIRIRHPEHHIKTPIRHILKNTLGFGGNNAALIISAPHRKGGLS